jgi:hypothetical protein
MDKGRERDTLPKHIAATPPMLVPPIKSKN